MQGAGGKTGSLGQPPSALPSSRLHLYSLCALFGAALLAVLCTFADYGMSWDEPYAVAYGRNALAFFTSLGADRAATQGLVALRGAPFHVFVEALAALAPEHGLLLRRLLTPLVGLLGVAGCYRLGALLAGPRAGLLAAALLLLTPAYYGHMFINPADLPFAAAYVWALFFAARFVQQWPRTRPSTLIGAALAIGLGASMRIGGVLVLGYVLLLLALRVLVSVRAQGGSAGTRLAAVGLGQLAALLALAYVALLALWPAAWLAPFAVPWAALQQAAAFPKHDAVLLAGEVFWSDALPWYYQLVYLLVQLPEALLLALALAVPATAARRSELVSATTTTAVPAAMVWLGALAPLAYACLLRPVFYDGMRHVLFVVPPLACLGAAGIAWLFARIASRPASCALAVALLAGGSLRTLASMVELHPYQYVHYNALAGGTRGAHGRYELDYWVTSFAEALRQLEATRAREPRPAPGTPPLRLTVCGPTAVAAVYLPPGFELSDDPARADFVLATTKWNCHQRYAGPVVAQVERAGVPFAVVKRLRPPLLSARTAAR